jgi:hypothetical protein
MLRSHLPGWGVAGVAIFVVEAAILITWRLRIMK